MNKAEEYAIAIIEDITEEGMSITKAGVKTLFKAYGGGLLPYAKDSYFNARFKIRLEEFANKEEMLDETTKKNFYENIDYKRLNYLFELFDKTRSTSFDIHAKILSSLYFNLLKTGDLNYFEVLLISNIITMHEDDFKILYEILKNSQVDGKFYGTPVEYTVEIPPEEVAIMKFMNLGIFFERKEKGSLIVNSASNQEKFPRKIDFVLGEYSKDLFHILDDIYAEWLVYLGVYKNYWKVKRYTLKRTRWE